MLPNKEFIMDFFPIACYIFLFGIGILAGMELEYQLMLRAILKRAKLAGVSREVQAVIKVLITGKGADL